jgi:hypothetical protein
MSVEKKIPNAETIEAMEEAKIGTLRKYTLEELLADLDADEPLSEEEREWINSPPVGREII